MRNETAKCGVFLGREPRGRSSNLGLKLGFSEVESEVVDCVERRNRDESSSNSGGC